MDFYFENTSPTKWSCKDILKIIKEIYPDKEHSYHIYVAKEKLQTIYNNHTKKKFRDKAKELLDNWSFYNQLAESSASTNNNQPASTVVNNFKNNKITSFNQNINKKREIDDSDDVTPLSIKKQNKSYRFYPPLAPSSVPNIPRLNKSIELQLQTMYQIKIGLISTDNMQESVKDEYEKNMKEQFLNKSLIQVPAAFSFLKGFFNQKFEDVPRYLWNFRTDGLTEQEKKAIEFLQYVLTDFHANCKLSPPPQPVTERTPFCQYLVPIFKYFNATHNLMTFIWCEKGLKSNKLLSVQFEKINDEKTSRKLMDGVGYTFKNKDERLVIESSGISDNEHTVEDTLKLIECTSNCLKTEMTKYQNASFNTFKNRKSFGLQYIDNKATLTSTYILSETNWASIEQRSAIIPTGWEERKQWVKTIELVFKLKDCLVEQEALTEALEDEEVGLKLVDDEDRVANRMRFEN